MKSAISNLKSRIGFTLVELLVVITIIVALLSLLAPSLDQAIYRAELTVCATNLKTIASGAALYAMDNERWYAPTEFRQAPYNVVHAQIRRLGGYMKINQVLNCPFSHTVDYEGSTSDFYMIPDHSLWFGWQYSGESAINRIGQTMTAPDYRDPAKPRQLSFNVLASTWDLYYNPGDTRGAHPDYGPNACRVNEWAKDQTAPQWGAANPAMVAANPLPQTYSFWWNHNTNERGLIDVNVAYQNGGVRIFDAVLMKNLDERMAQVSPVNPPATAASVSTPLPYAQ